MLVKADLNKIENVLGDICSSSEIFPVSAGIFGLSIPTSVIDSVGEDEVFRRLEEMERFWLWLGQWQK